MPPRSLGPDPIASRNPKPHLPEPPLPDELADLGLSLLGDLRTPVWSSLRHYDSHMIDALRGRGFSVLLTQMLLVKELALRVPVAEKGLVPSFG